MISYEDALERHNKQPLHKNILDQARWKEVEVGSQEYWQQMNTGKLAAFEDTSGVYVGIVQEYDFEWENSSLWIYFLPDPTKSPLPMLQDALPVCFGARDKIMIEVV
jgi:hypothetical protein